MATKDYFLLMLKDKQNNVTDNGQYNNFTLNKNCPFSSDASFERSKRVITERRKILDYVKQIKRTAAPIKLSDFTNDLQTKKESSHSWNKSTKDLSSKFVNNGFGKEDKLKKRKALSDSTLSLHIEVYENSNESNLFDVGTKESFKKNELVKNGFNAEQINFDSTLVIQNEFEFPRQQENGEILNPEIAQYRASQQLFNPNLRTQQANSQQPLPQNSVKRTTVVRISKKGEEIIKTPSREAADRRGERRETSCNAKDVVAKSIKERPGSLESLSEDTIVESPVSLETEPKCKTFESGFLERLTNGTIIGSFKIIQILGEGSQGEVYKVERNDGKLFALKIGKDASCTKRIEMEITMLKKTTEKKFAHFCQYIDDGIYKEYYRYFVMSLVGKNLAYLSDEKEEFSKGAALIVAKQALKALENLHSLGYIHRDLMPCNFTIGLKDDDEGELEYSRTAAAEKISNFHTVYLIDLGMCQNPHITNAKESTICGNRYYASIASHENLELTYKDDLESFVYLLIRWLGLSSYEHDNEVSEVIYPKKKEMFNDCKANGVLLPGTLPGIIGYIRDLGLGEKPNYGYLMDSLNYVHQKKDVTLVPDWDKQFMYFGPRYALVPHLRPAYYIVYFNCYDKLCVSLHFAGATFTFNKSYSKKMTKHSVFKCNAKIEKKKQCLGRLIVAEFVLSEIKNFQVAKVVGKGADHICGAAEMPFILIKDEAKLLAVPDEDDWSDSVRGSSSDGESPVTSVGQSIK